MTIFDLNLCAFYSNGASDIKKLKHLKKIYASNRTLVTVLYIERLAVCVCNTHVLYLRA